MPSRRSQPLPTIQRFTWPVLLLALYLGPWTAPRAQQAKPLAEADLIKLVELQFGDDAIAARVQKSVVAFPVDARALERLRQAGASEAILAALRQAGRSAEAITYQGILGLLRQGRGEDRRVIALKPDAEAYFQRSRAQLGLGRYEEARRDYDEAIRLDPRNAEA